MRNLNLKLFTLLLFSTLIFTLQGCGTNLEENEKKILAYDPSFRDYIDKRDALQEKLSEQKDAFARKKIEIDEKIDALKEKISQLKEEYASSIGNTKRQLQPQKRSLKQDLLEMKRRYALKKSELNTVSKDISEVDSLIKKKDKLNLTQEEMQTWNKRLSAQLEKKVSIESEMAKLEKEIEVTRLKIKVLEVD